ncbi:MAG: tRNA pseudouridine synthase B [Nitrospinaceae bacterium]|nr:MAG: tRNA pseudouridine synthase B [Nitrospinaceae bacterium]
MVQAVKKIVGAKKAGHIGTLDPMAEGILPICMDRSTRIIQFLSSLPKGYIAEMVLGTSTDTQDATGTVTHTGNPENISETEVRSALKGFLGAQDQIPPMFSAKKKQGIPLYKLARNGITIDRKPVRISMYSIEFLKKEDNRVTFEVQCSAGTYIRTLCYDIGQKLGCEAHMSRLVRNRVGDFDLETSLTLEELETAVKDGCLSDKLIPVEKALNFLPEIRIKESFVNSIANGIAPSKSSLETIPRKFQPGMNLRVSHVDSHLLAIAEPIVDQDTYARLAPREVAFKLKRVLI